MSPHRSPPLVKRKAPLAFTPREHDLHLQRRALNPNPQITMPRSRRYALRMKLMARLEGPERIEIPRRQRVRTLATLIFRRGLPSSKRIQFVQRIASVGHLDEVGQILHTAVAKGDNAIALEALHSLLSFEQREAYDLALSGFRELCRDASPEYRPTYSQSDLRENMHLVQQAYKTLLSTCTQRTPPVLVDALKEAFRTAVQSKKEGHYVGRLEALMLSLPSEEFSRFIWATKYVPEIAARDEAARASAPNDRSLKKKKKRLALDEKKRLRAERAHKYAPTRIIPPVNPRKIPHFPAHLKPGKRTPLKRN